LIQITLGLGNAGQRGLIRLRRNGGFTAHQILSYGDACVIDFFTGI